LPQEIGLPEEIAMLGGQGMKLKRQSVAPMVAFVAFAVATLLPAYAHATTVTMGDPNVPLTFTMGTGCFPCAPGEAVAQSFTPDAEVNFAPGSGVIRSWRAEAQGTVKLIVLESAPEGGWVAVGTSAAGTSLEGQPNATSLPIGADDMIGVNLGPSSPGKSVVGFDELTNAEVLRWASPLTNDEMAREPDNAEGDRRLQLNAEIVLAPIVSSISPTSGSNAGGNAVTIGGRFLDGATGVSFGSAPASSFSVDSSSQITAIAPSAAASTVDVRVTGPGGSNEVGPADKYAFTAPAGTTNPAPKTLIQGGPTLAPASPAITGFSESATRWRRGRSLPRISSAGGTPVGTTFSFSLNEAATATFTFTHSVAGRRAHGRCVAPSHGRAHKPKCKHTVVVGSFGVSGNTGLDKVRFQGRLSSAKTLVPGTYAVSIAARDAHGLKAISRSLPFTIVS
jgi:IPT/TIG domain